MTYAIRISEINDQCPSALGGKAHTLARMIRAGLRVPDGLCIPVQAYQDYVTSTGLLDRILITLFRKRFEDMRWEEIWDVSLRVRNLFLVTPLPRDLRESLLHGIAAALSGGPVAVRSSAPGEDAASTSFAGLHESFLNVVGTDSILEHVRLVWASLWSDRALLYRQEIGLDVRHSAMAVLVQDMVAGERSGVAFTRNPADPSQGIVEAVHGLNQGLVDGSVEPDRWILDRATRGGIVGHRPAQRDHALVPSSSGIQQRPLSRSEAARPPLDVGEVHLIFNQALELEALFGAPQDVEWTFRADRLFLLQARPITRTGAATPEDSRLWYLSLRRNLDNLKALRVRIEEVHLPAMAEEARRWASADPRSFTDAALADETERRLDRCGYWEKTYKEDFIPFAHGMRLFGQFYADLVHPADPYEFMDLLTGADLLSKRRNLLMEKLAGMLREDTRLAEAVRTDDSAAQKGPYGELLKDLLDEFGDTSWGDVRLAHERRAVIGLLLEMAKQTPRSSPAETSDPSDRERRFLALFEADRVPLAKDLLDIGRASYRLRDNDNVYLGKLKGQLLALLAEGRRRLAARGWSDLPASLPPGEVAKALRDPLHAPTASPGQEAAPREAIRLELSMKVRQVVGQPASPGIGVGAARVVTCSEELFAFRAGEVLVCDAIDPNMTFVVPLAAGIVERRGGMLIHGAIIAREYGIPCVTGVPEATAIIRTGDRVSVDGHLGIVVVG